MTKVVRFDETSPTIQYRGSNDVCSGGDSSHGCSTLAGHALGSVARYKKSLIHRQKSEILRTHRSAHIKYGIKIMSRKVRKKFTVYLEDQNKCVPLQSLREIRTTIGLLAQLV